MDNEAEVILHQMEGTRESLAQKLETLESQVMGTIENASKVVSDATKAVSNTTSSVTDVVDQVKEAVEGAVESVKESVTDTVESVKHSLDISEHVRRNPWLAFGGSLAAGFLTGNLVRLLMPAGPSSGRGYRREVGAPSLSSFAGSTKQQPSYAASPQPAAQSYGQEVRPESGKGGGGFLGGLTGMFGSELSKLKGMAIGTAMAAVRDIVTRSTPQEMGSQLADMINNVTTKLGGDVVHSSILPEPPPASAGREQQGTPGYGSFGGGSATGPAGR